MGKIKTFEFYLVYVDADTFSLSTTPAGGAMDLVDVGTGTHFISHQTGVTINAAGFTLAANAVVHSNGKGFAAQQGPGRAGNEAKGATHGGRGGDNFFGVYGSPTAPVTLAATISPPPTL